MLNTLDLRSQRLSRRAMQELMPRNAENAQEASSIATRIIEEVRSEGSAALKRHAADFDSVDVSTFKMSAEYLRTSLNDLDSALQDAIEVAIARVTQASSLQLPGGNTSSFGPGAHVRQRWVPVDRVGLYVPGGKAVYPSSVVMNTVPAVVAGVGSIVIASPAQKDFGGNVHPVIAATAELLGIKEVYAIGGASAIAALAYGVADIDLEPVSVITGPGNRFVSAAKRLVSSAVGIDAEAGPTEILIIADESANPIFIARDLVSQAEHDENAAALLVTHSAALAERVTVAVTELASSTTHSARVIEALTGPQSAIVLVEDVIQAIEFSNAYAPEHLELHTADNEAVLRSITNAGAIFLGDYSPVSVGDYLAGSNHVLPTFGQAKFSSALNTTTFLRSQQIIDYDKVALSETQSRIRVFADAENLPAHADAVDARFESDGGA